MSDSKKTSFVRDYFTENADDRAFVQLFVMFLTDVSIVLVAKLSF